MMNTRVATRLKAVSLAIGALLALASPFANAAVIRVDNVNANVTQGSTSFNLDVNGDGTTDISFWNTHTYNFSANGGNYYNSSTGATGTIFGFTGGAGVPIGPSTSYSSWTADHVEYGTTQGACTSWRWGSCRAYATDVIFQRSVNFLGNNQFLAFSFNNHGQTDYGWINLSISVVSGDYNQGFSTVIKGYGYDNTGAIVNADAAGTSATPPTASGSPSSTVPEPGSLMLLALGAAAMTQYRRRSH